MLDFVRPLLWPFVRRIRRPDHPIAVASESDFWKLAARVGLPKFRRFRRPLTVAEVDAEFGGWLAEWEAVKQSLQPVDELWPFEFNQHSLAYRKGIVVLRDGEAVAGILAAVS